MVFELYVDQVPKTVENFRALCTGECGVSESTDRSLHYKNTNIFRVIPGHTVVGGDISSKGDGSGGESIFGAPFEVEGTELKHDRAGVLSMEPRPSALDDPNPTPCTSQFAVTLKRCPERDGQCCVFGRLIRGFGALREIEKVATGSRQQPIQAVVVTNCGELEPGDDGVVVGADGDPFPPWPQDYPNMGDKGMEYLARVAASETIKSFGNEAFNNGDYLVASRKYTKALRYLEKNYTREAEVYQEEAEHKQSQKQHAIPTLLNLAAVQLKLGDFRGAIESCDKVHEWENMGRLQMYAEIWNPKMLYRRGMAKVMCNDFEDGITDLGRASMLEPNNSAIRKELDKGVRRMEERKQRERRAYSKMFG